MEKYLTTLSPGWYPSLGCYLYTHLWNNRDIENSLKLN